MKRTLAAVLLLVGSSIAAPRETPVPSPRDPAFVPAAGLADVRPVGSGGASLGAPLDPDVAQSVERRSRPEVAGSTPAFGANGGAPQPRTASEPIAPSGDGWITGDLLP